MIFWIVDNTTNETISGGLSKEQVIPFIKFNERTHLLDHLIVHCNNGGEWTARVWMEMEERIM